MKINDFGMPDFSKAAHRFIVPCKLTSKKTFSSALLSGMLCAFPAACNTKSKFDCKTGTLFARFS